MFNHPILSLKKVGWTLININITLYQLVCCPCQIWQVTRYADSVEIRDARSFKFQSRISFYKGVMRISNYALFEKEIIQNLGVEMYRRYYGPTIT